MTIGSVIGGATLGVVGFVLLIAFIALYVVDLIGLGYLTKFAYASKLSSNEDKNEEASYCVEMPDWALSMTQVAIVLTWFSVILTPLAFLVYKNTFMKVLAVGLTIISIIGLVFLSKFSFGAKDVGGNVKCVKIKKWEMIMCQIAIVLLWIQIVLSMFAPGALSTGSSFSIGSSFTRSGFPAGRDFNSVIGEL